MSRGVPTLLAVACLLASTSLIAQNEPSPADTIQRVSNQESWYNSELPKDADPKKDSVAVPLEELPSKILKTLRTTDALAGWKNGKVYRDVVNDIYKLYIPEEQLMKIYSLTPAGIVVSFHSYRTP
jgi:hypothetical protein